MNGSHSLLTKFLKPKIRLGAILRGVIVAAFSMVTTTGIIYVNYIGYWKGTIYRTQTVDFNILANLLPRKISSQLLSKDIKGLQKSLDSNYGLFGIIITNCKSIKISCPNQKIIYASKAKIEEVDGYKRKLISKENYTFSWLQKLNNADFLEAELRSELFIPLYNPPAIEQTWEFTTPRESNIVYSKQINQGEVIGRIYLLRAEPPLFAEELRQWLHNPWSMSSKILAYNAIALAALLTGLFVWLLSEILYSLNVETEKKLRISAENEAKILKEKIEAEEAVKIAEKDRHIAIENELKAVQEKQAAEEVALAATQKGTQAIQEKQAAEEVARAAVLKSEQAIQEKQAAEEAALVATQKGEQAIQEKQAAQEAARAAVLKSEQAIQEKQAAEEAARAAVLKSEQAIQEKQAAERIAQQNEQAIQEKQAAQEVARAAVLKSEQAIQEKQAAQEAARAAVLKSEQAIQEKQAAEEAARAAVLKSEQAIQEKQAAERIAQQNEQAIQEKQAAQEVARAAVLKSEQAIQEKQAAQEAARAAVLKSEQAIQEKQAAEEAARAAVLKSEQAIQEKQAAEEITRVATQKSKQAIQEKQAAEEAALIAIREREEARKHADYLYDSIQEQTRELVIKDEDSRIETSEPHYHHSFEVIHQSSQSPLTLDIIIQHRTFFEWIDSEIRSTYDVDSWLKSYPQFRSLVKENSNGQICLNDLGTLLNCAVNEIFDDRPRLKWPKGVALPPSKKYGISLEPHHRPRGWEKFVNDLCEIDCVRRVAYDNCGYGGSDIKVVDADSGTIACRYGPVGTCLPLRIDTTARGKEQTELVIEYIRKYIQ